MISTRLFQMIQMRGMTGALRVSQNAFVKTPARFFAKDNEAEEAEAEAAAEPEPVAKPTPAPKKAAPKKAAAAAAAAAVADEAPLDRALFQPFSIGNIKKIDSTPNHKPPSSEDTIEGRYSGVLFTTASQNGDLYKVYEDMRYMQEIFKNSEMFRLFTENGGVGANEIRQLNQALRDTAQFSETTLHFLTVLADNKRLNFIEEIAEKYAKLYQEFNKEEKITIISASDLSDDQKTQVMAALQANPENTGKQFTIDYEVDETIMGGLQMYTESEFMDMSLSSRLTRISAEVSKLSH
mmetsp:Transcript_6558/g.7849  ORF Transcript_6558/g.7849 Transcript_6558/m.7849 type:complete len:295 (-) Transcript_6558:3659-4543(-)|eukprot:CAMPEP_0170452834 /NCGR_PEP_ID=MMETSP0123-20130129/1604_1 /TAXON_ID=182087 /ORGANISM="Favella ehrenbergii, Strain Fehren 1" /LENGTH=294 /DNA_ID=CAMNT_0010714979 /DNA_START=12 /DNA_END=896 /DNA_ORIENTATION=+